VQPKPQYKRIEFRELIKRRDDRLARRGAVTAEESATAETATVGPPR
jgi:hypothetical protein